MKTSLSVCITCMILFGFGSLLVAQNGPAPRQSPIALAAIKADNAYIKVVYGQPSKNNRVIFGELVPYNKVWRTGANEATEITFTKDILFAGERVPAGTYSLFTVPTEGDWTVILNKDLGMWGHYTYKEANDLLRVTASPHKLDEPMEAFRISLRREDTTVFLTLSWDETGVSVPITVVN